MGDDYNQFSTNNYANRNHYLDLNSNQQNSDKYFGDGVQPPVDLKKDKSFWENFGEHNKNFGLATKKAINTGAIKVN